MDDFAFQIHPFSMTNEGKIRQKIRLRKEGEMSRLQIIKSSTDARMVFNPFLHLHCAYSRSHMAPGI